MSRSRHSTKAKSAVDFESYITGALVEFERKVMGHRSYLNSAGLNDSEIAYFHRRQLGLIELQIVNSLALYGTICRSIHQKMDHLVPAVNFNPNRIPVHVGETRVGLVNSIDLQWNFYQLNRFQDIEEGSATIFSR